uniref:Reverse transcriptase/retrotransposon-derived protein RNase H-like domain-containing protein n=1 Tax=Sinocyclocheilus anshuiensis TaxID=1608454 RepID=A0A671NXE0_9TELE
MMECSFGLNQVEVLGHLVTSQGIKPDPKKVEAVCGAPRPQNVSQLRSFLGTCGNFANISEPLRRLTRKDVPWEWTTQTEQSFNSMKVALTSEPCLAYFHLNAPTYVMSDASPVGLGAILLQRQGDGHNKPVAYASHSLTQKYSFAILTTCALCLCLLIHYFLFLLVSGIANLQ